MSDVFCRVTGCGHLQSIVEKTRRVTADILSLTKTFRLFVFFSLLNSHGWCAMYDVCN